LQSLATVTDPAFNKLSAIFHLLSPSKIKWRPVHVKGHQDDSQPTEELSRLAQLNDEMHLMAKLHLKHATFCRLYTILHEAWSIWHQGKKYHTSIMIIYILSCTLMPLEHTCQRKATLMNWHWTSVTGSPSLQQLALSPAGRLLLLPSTLQVCAGSVSL